MKVKIKETFQTVIPRYETNGNVLTLKIYDKFKWSVFPVNMIPPVLWTNIPFLIFYDGATGAYPAQYDIRAMDGRNDSPAFNALGAQRMPFVQTSDPYYLWTYDGTGITTGWTNKIPAQSLRYDEGYDTSAFNYVTQHEVNGLVRSLVLQGVTASDSKYIYLNWFEDHRDIGHFGFGTMTGPSDDLDVITFNNISYIEQPRAIISENNQGKTQRQNYTEMWKTVAKVLQGGTGTDGITFNGLKHYFPNCLFGVYNWPPFAYYFSTGENNATISDQNLETTINFVADAFIDGATGYINCIDMLMPSFYSSLNSPEMNRLRSIQGMSLCVKINEKLKQSGKTTKLIIPFVCPLYLTSQTGGPYQTTNITTIRGVMHYKYIPPYTIMYDDDMSYEQLQPIVDGGGNGATIWLGASYTTIQAMGRVTDGTLEDTTPQPSWRKWPFLHPGGTTYGINQWSDKTLLRQALSAHYNYTSGICLGITGNRWWWATAGVTTSPSPAEVSTPVEWLPLGLSLSPYGNKVAYSNGFANAGATSTDGTINIIRGIYEDSKYRAITNYINLWNVKYNE